VNLILRTSWVYSMRQGGFVTKVLQWAREQEVLRVVDDQISSPTSARMLAEITALVLAQGRDDVFGYLREKAAYITARAAVPAADTNGPRLFLNLTRGRKSRW